MLAHLLAVAVALGSFGLYFSAFFFPEVHRKSDFYWSGLGLFYALVLWVCAGRVTGGVLLGQMASAILLLWFGTQTVILRRRLASPEEKPTFLKPLPPLSNFYPQKHFGKKSEAATNSQHRLRHLKPVPHQALSLSNNKKKQHRQPRENNLRQLRHQVANLNRRKNKKHRLLNPLPPKPVQH